MIESLLQYDPAERSTPSAAALHPFFADPSIRTDLTDAEKTQFSQAHRQMLARQFGIAQDASALAIPPSLPVGGGIPPSLGALASGSMIDVTTAGGGAAQADDVPMKSD